MIARLWTATATPAGAADYRQHLEGAVFPQLAAIPGQRGAWLFVGDSTDGVELQVVTLWESMAAVHAFAGPEPAVAVVEPRAREVLTRWDERVRHFTVAARLEP